jgi:ribosomal protein S18 acetylase RimI-like enzyme
MNNPVESASAEEPAEDRITCSEIAFPEATDNLVASAQGERVRDISLDDDVADAAEVCLKPTVEVPSEPEEPAAVETSVENHREQVAAMTTEVINHQEKFRGSYAQTEDEKPTTETKEKFAATLQKVASERPVDDDDRGDMVRIPGEPYDTIEENRYTNFQSEPGEPQELHAEISNEASAVATAKEEGPPKPVSGKANLYARGPEGLRDTEYEYTQGETSQITKIETQDGECVGSGEPTDEEVREATSLVKEIFTVDEEVSKAEADPPSEAVSDTKTGLVPRAPRDESELSPEEQQALQEAQSAPVEMGKGETGSVKLPHAGLSYAMDVDEAGKKIAYIAGIEVEDELQGFGLGTRLLGEFMVRCVAEEVDYIRGFAISRSGLRSHLRAFGEATIEFFDEVRQPGQVASETILPMTPQQALQSLRQIEQTENSSRTDEIIRPILSIGMKTDVAAYAAAHPEVELQVEEYRRKKEEESSANTLSA